MDTTPLIEDRLPAESALPPVPVDATKMKSDPAYEATVETCEKRIALLQPSSHQQSLDQYRATLPFIVAEAKVYPVLYLRKPERSTDRDKKDILVTLADSPRPRNAIRSVLNRYKNNKPFLRDIFFSQNYFFDDESKTAPAMVQEITLADLFDDSVIYRLRNNDVQPLERNGAKYMDKDGEEATLYLNDRVSNAKEDLAAPLHLDLEEVRRKTGAQRTLPKIVDTDAAWVDLVFPFGDVRSALVQLVQGKTETVCIGGDSSTLSAVLKDAGAFWARHQQIRISVQRLVSERLLFDEPKDELEDIQEDGELRLSWKDAYFGGKKKFTYREVEYNVFDRKGNPTPPQVCVDFVLDTWERASGTWYCSRKGPPARTKGEIDFSVLENFSRRHIASILTFAALYDAPFERYDVPRRNWIPLEFRRRFIKNLVNLSDKFREGDVLVIHGLRDEDEKEHFHTVLILSTDPVTGIPTVVADNQGRPRISSLKNAMRAAPRRSIKYRLRLNFEKMKTLTQTAYQLRAASEQQP